MTPAVQKFHNHYFYKAQRRIKDDALSPVSANSVSPDNFQDRCMTAMGTSVKLVVN